MKNTRPTSNTKNVTIWKDKETKNILEHIVQWREKSITSMFESCKLEIRDGNLLHRSYFHTSIPLFVKKVKPMEGLCPYHMSARKWERELE